MKAGNCHKTLLVGCSVWALSLWLVTPGVAADKSQVPESWTRVAAGVYQSPGSPHAYALVDGASALVIGAARQANLAGLRPHGVKSVESVLVTHHHRDTAAQVGHFLKSGIRVRAPKLSAPWLTMEGVRKFWDTAIPSPKPSEMLRTFTQWNFLVHAEGFEGIDCSLEGGQTITWRSWSIQVIATPGHSSDHVVFAAKRTGATSSAGGPLVLFAGDALSGPGKMWSPYMTDWDHWTDQGLQKALDSLYRLASLDAAILFPEHGPPITRNTKEALAATANAAAEVAFLKSFERYNERLGDPPAYALLNEKGLTTIPGDKPWAQLSTHLFVTRNTYALVSKEGPVLIVDA